MELYTLDPAFERDTVLDVWESAIWTERYSEAGDFQLVLPATHDRLKSLALGRMLECKGSKEIMVVENQELLGGMLTATGRSLETALNSRSVPRPFGVANAQTTTTFRDTPPEFIVRDLVYHGAADLALLPIPGLVLGQPPDQVNPNVVETVSLGGLYDAVYGVAKKYGVGIRIDIHRNEDGSFQAFTFESWVGKDRTSTSLAHNLVRLSPDTDTLANVKEVRSDKDWKTMVAVYPPSGLAEDFALQTEVIAYAHPWSDDDPPTGWDLRLLEVETEDITKEMVQHPSHSSARNATLPTLTELMNQRAYAALEAHKKTRAIDGEIVPNDRYRLGVNFFLGDKIEQEGYFGNPVKGMVTEYIRSHDASGPREYPTVVDISASGSVVDNGGVSTT